MKHLLHSCNLFCAMLLLFSATTKTNACTGKDIVFTNITITSIVNDNGNVTYNYSYTIKNIGTTDIERDNISIQNYVSTDAQLGNDGAAGGASVSYNTDVIISPGETYSGVFGAYPFPQNPQSTYPYLIAHIYLYPDAECDVTNNDYVKLIEVTTGIASPSIIANASLNWDVENKSFTVNEWSESNSELQYSVYTTSGQLLLSGSAQQKESTPLKGLNNGVYILHLTDEKKVYSKKIIY